MSLFITSLNSGSNGNCYYISNGQDSVLIDAGISCKEIEKRIERSGLGGMEKIKAVFISHEHSDHISGIPTLLKKYKLPVYITPKTYHAAGFSIHPKLIYGFEAHQPVQVGSLCIIAFPKNHDAVDPHSFIVSSGGVTVGIFTDIGSACEHVIKYFRQCHAAFLETNYDERLLQDGRYPPHLKKRISSSQGHLSNEQAFELFMRHRPQFMKLLMLSHLSAENNRPAIAESLFTSASHKVDIIMTYRHKETKLYHVSNENIVIKAAAQLSLF